MSLPALATIEGLEARGVECADRVRARAAIDDASAIIHDETAYRWVTTDGELDEAMPPVVTAIAYKVIRRALSAADDVQSEQLGPFQATRFNRDGDVYLTRDEKERLHGTTGSKTGLSVLRTEAPWPVYRRCNPVGYFDPAAEAVE